MELTHHAKFYVTECDTRMFVFIVKVHLHIHFTAKSPIFIIKRNSTTFAGFNWRLKINFHLLLCILLFVQYNGTCYILCSSLSLSLSLSLSPVLPDSTDFAISKTNVLPAVLSFRLNIYLCQFKTISDLLQGRGMKLNWQSTKNYLLTGRCRI